MKCPLNLTPATYDIIAQELSKHTDDELNLNKYYCIYAICDPSASNIIIWYIGQTNNIRRRLYQHYHFIDSNKHLTNKLVKYVFSKHIEPKHIILTHCTNMREMIIAEISWISYYKDLGNTLCNIAHGGQSFKGFEGHYGPRSQRFKDAMKGNTRGLGKTHNVSSETREKLRQANLGKKQSPETIEKKRLALQGYKHSDQSRKNMSGPKSESHRYNMSQANLGKKHSDATKKKLRDCNLGKKQSPATIKKRQLTCHTKHQEKYGFTPEQFVTTRKQCPFCVELLGLNETTVVDYINAKRIQSPSMIRNRQLAFHNRHMKLPDYSSINYTSCQFCSNS